jgi:hypothetical protein
MKRRQLLTGFAAASVGLSVSAAAQNKTYPWFAELDRIQAVLNRYKEIAEAKARLKGRSFDSFLTKEQQADSADRSLAFERAADWSSATGAPVFVSGTHYLDRGAKLTQPGATLVFDDCVLQIGEENNRVQTRIGEHMPIGLLVSANNIALLGKCKVEGLGERGKTYVNGLYCEENVNTIIGTFSFENLAFGLHVMCCDFFQCEKTDAHSMWGLQDQGNGAGTAQVVSGCRWSSFGELVSLSNDKPARYLSVGHHSVMGQRDNTLNEYGKVYVTGREGSPWSQATGIRSSVKSRFKGGFASNVSTVLLCVKYNTDRNYHITQNDFGDWEGHIYNSTGNTDNGCFFYVNKDSGEIGENFISSLDVHSEALSSELFAKLGISGADTFGIYCNSGSLTIGTARTSGVDADIHAENCNLLIGKMTAEKPRLNSLIFGTDASVQIDDYTLSPRLEVQVLPPKHFTLAYDEVSKANIQINRLRILTRGNEALTKTIVAELSQLEKQISVQNRSFE